ncbi:MAG TPA: FGGY family carbohydrate kinase [Roseiarcus sp.]
MNGDAGMNGCVAVFDIGKTNMKVVVFDAAGQVVAERGHPNGSLLPDARWPYKRLYTEGAWTFLIGALKELGARFPIEAISISAHGAAGVLVGDKDDALPAVDYEFDIDGAIAAEYDKVRPLFEETLSPNLPRGLNLGRQVYYLQRRFPTEFAAARAFLGYPQYWSWRLSGVAATEFTSVGSHTDLWRPKEGDLSSMVDRLGWRRLFPPLRKAWDTLGTLKPEIAADTGLAPDVRIVCGAHDSNASLVPHLLSRREPFTVISTGTWVIVMAVGGKGRLDPKADMLANVDVRGEPVPTARFMGGREFGVLAGDTAADAEEADLTRVIASGALALPAFSDQGGPFASRKGVIEGETPTTPKARAALATLYAALVTAHVIERLEAPGDLIVEGGFTRSPAFAAVLARLMPGRKVMVAPMSAGAAAGAAMLAHWSEPHPPPRLEPARAWDLPGLDAYRNQWERAL